MSDTSTILETLQDLLVYQRAMQNTLQRLPGAMEVNIGFIHTLQKLAKAGTLPYSRILMSRSKLWTWTYTAFRVEHPGDLGLALVFNGSPELIAEFSAALTTLTGLPVELDTKDSPDV